MRKSFMKDILEDDLRAPKKKKTASDVIDLLRMEYGVDLTYSQAYHGLQFTKRFLWGDDIKSYLDFLWYKEAIEHYNPGSVVNFEYDGVTRRFKRFFVAFETSITGFNNYCHPMLFIDCTFLTGKFKGGLMVACGKTGNQEIYPVAFGIVESENCDSWEWFLTNLKGIIREDRPLTIISDLGIGLLKHVPVVFPKAFHSYCLYHMKENIPVPKGKSRQTAVKRLYSRPIYLIPDSEKPPGINEKGYIFPPTGGREQDGRPKGVRYRGSREKVQKKRKCG
ncbi:uncharacterized protein LOC113318558 [Papaver somniferum]|uniref:uncharacterized protein LOC113318558 n=1 Tax=Papaver somniferum TaxID=3469 RepID=UPI000E702E5D|nr:uncharacterized protein LOC113318558 [Papaver somniferum]